MRQHYLLRNMMFARTNVITRCAWRRREKLAMKVFCREVLSFPQVILVSCQLYTDLVGSLIIILLVTICTIPLGLNAFDGTLSASLSDYLPRAQAGC